MVMQMGLQFGSKMLDEGKGRLSAIETSELRRRFAVTHEYVLNKLRLIAFPFRHKFERAGGSDDFGDESGSLGGLRGAPASDPASDVLAPELYLPLMALITYVVLSAFGRGLSATAGLAPGDLATTITASSLLLLLEALAIKLWRMFTSLPPPSFLDTLAQFGYFFVSVCYAVAARGLFDVLLPVAAWGALAYNMAAFCFFTYMSLRESFKKDGVVPTRAVPILYAATIVQAPPRAAPSWRRRRTGTARTCRARGR